MMLENKVARDLDCLEATKLILPYFKLPKVEHNYLEDSIISTALASIFTLAIADEFIRNDLAEMIKHPKKWNEWKKKEKATRMESLDIEQKAKEEFVRKYHEKTKALISLGLESLEQRCLYSSLRQLGVNLNEVVYVSDFLKFDKNVTTTTLAVDSKGNSLRIEIDRTNLIKIMEEQLHAASSSISIGNPFDKDYGSRYMDFDYENKAVEILTEEIYNRTADGNMIKFLEMTLAKADKDKFQLERYQLI